MVDVEVDSFDAREAFGATGGGVVLVEFCAAVLRLAAHGRRKGGGMLHLGSSSALRTLLESIAW